MRIFTLTLKVILAYSFLVIFLSDFGIAVMLAS